jgi:predicted DsbA family dithiol-disulfide isomerase
MTAVRISYFSDVLCVWAYAAHRRLEELCDHFQDKVTIEPHFCSVFPDAHTKIQTNWKDRGGFEGFNAHVNEVAARFPHVDVCKDLWTQTRPRTSMTAHIFLKAVSLIEGDTSENRYTQTLAARADWAVRRAFFANGQDISDWNVLKTIASTLGVDEAALAAKLQSSEAIAALAADLNLCQASNVTTSPTYIMNEGRQKLIGNVGYRVLEANVEELLRTPSDSSASWC